MAKPTAQPSSSNGSSAAPAKSTPAQTKPPTSNKAPAQTKPPEAPKPAPAQEKLPSGVQHGFIVMVNPKEGYGFIRASNADVDHDVHFSTRQVDGRRNVHAGQAVSYYLTRTDKGMTAINVKPGSVFSIPYLKFLLVGVVSALLLLAGLVVVLNQPATLTVWLALWVISFSIATYGVYAYDKAQAQSQGLRVPEIVLHMMEALGGTLGAFVAMRVLHHKNRKREYQIVFWLIVAAQVAFLAWLLLLR